LCGVLALIWAGASCSSGPRPPEPGTPAFYWAAAKSTYATGDFRKTGENLSQLRGGVDEFASRARPLSVVVSAGLARGYFDLAESYEAGAKMNRANPTPFRKQTSNLRSMASSAVLDFAEGVRLLADKDKDPNLTLACQYPTGSMAEPPALRKIAGGATLQDAEKDLLETAMLQRGVVMTMSSLVGSPDDSARTLELFKAGEPSIPRATFLFGAAKALYDLSALYGPTRLDLPNRIQMLSQEALDTLQTIPENKDSKALAARIQASLKKLRPGT